MNSRIFLKKNFYLLLLCNLGLFEDGQEYQYTYLTYTLSGVREPVASGSSFGIRGNVVIQKTPGQAIVKVILILNFQKKLIGLKINLITFKLTVVGFDSWSPQRTRIPVEHCQVPEEARIGTSGETFQDFLLERQGERFRCRSFRSRVVHQLEKGFGNQAPARHQHRREHGQGRQRLRPSHRGKNP